MKRRTLIPILLILIAVIGFGAAIGGSKVKAQNKEVGDLISAQLAYSNEIFAKVSKSLPVRYADLGLAEYVATDEFEAYVTEAANLYPAKNYDDFCGALERDTLLLETKARMKKICNDWRTYIAADNRLFANASVLALGKGVCLGTPTLRLEDRYKEAKSDFSKVSGTIVALVAKKCGPPKPATKHSSRGQ